MGCWNGGTPFLHPLIHYSTIPSAEESRVISSLISADFRNSETLSYGLFVSRGSAASRGTGANDKIERYAKLTDKKIEGQPRSNVKLATREPQRQAAGNFLTHFGERSKNTRNSEKGRELLIGHSNPSRKGSPKSPQEIERHIRVLVEMGFELLVPELQ